MQVLNVGNRIPNRFQSVTEQRKHLLFGGQSERGRAQRERHHSIRSKTIYDIVFSSFHKEPLKNLRRKRYE